MKQFSILLSLNFGTSFEKTNIHSQNHNLYFTVIEKFKKMTCFCTLVFLLDDCFEIIYLHQKFSNNTYWPGEIDKTIKL